MTQNTPPRQRRRTLIALIVMSVGVLGSCGWFPWYLEPDTASPSDRVFYHDLDDVDTERTIHYSVDLGPDPASVYIVFTNPTGAIVGGPIIREMGSITGESGSTAMTATARALAQEEMLSGPIALRDNPAIADWERPLGAASRGPAYSLTTEWTPPPSPGAYQSEYDIAYDDSDGTLGGLYDFAVDTVDASGSFIASVLAERVQAETQYGPKTLEIWVEDAEYDPSGTDPGKIRPAMATALAATFLNQATTSTDDDIYDWIAGVYGEEWSDDVTFVNLIPEQDTITILLYNIEGDGAGGIVGYFWPKDNFTRTDFAYSNERIMFYIDSETFATRDPDLTPWDIDDYWPTEIVSTLAHELQHMIHYHQRDVLRGTTTPVWLEEMMSLAAEDLVEEKRMKRGPRGVDPQTDGGTAGPAGNPDGRLPLYNLYNDINLTYFDYQSEDVLQYYAMAYSFGAFLGRNYGGAQVFQEMARSTSSLTDSILSDAIAAAGGPEGMTLEALLWRWGAAVLLSTDTSQATPYRYNAGGWIPEGGDTLGYQLGSINLYNYENRPFVYTNDISEVDLQPNSKLLYRVGTALTGVIDLEFEVNEGMDFAVVVK